MRFLEKRILLNVFAGTKGYLKMIKELANICLVIILILLSISLILLGIMAIIYLIGLIKETLYEIQVDDKERNNHGKR